ncbi:MAG: response regulator transcription factor [Deltaproteobacteria bacterium]|nr:response regulator transcription factor [Deltaproteobacteria bacterium]
MAEDIGGVLRLIDPKGRVVYASRPYGEIEVVAQVAAIETAPQWAVEVLWPKEQGRAETAGSPGLVSLSLGVGVLLVALLWLLLSARKKESSRDLSPRNPQAADFPASVPIATENESEAEQFQIGDAIVDLDRHLVVRGEAEHPLTVREVDLLRLMMAAPNQVIHRQRMLDEAWGYSAEVTSRTVDTFVYRLRQKIEPDPQAPRHFLTVRGAGYRFVP